MRKTSFKTKLRILVLTTCSLVLVPVSGVFITDKIITFRDNLISSTLTLARVTGTNTSAALTFDDPDNARVRASRPCAACPRSAKPGS